jgi:uracil-DNA glycosylase family protein
MPFGPASANVILSGESAASASSRSCGTADSKSKDLSVANYDSAEKGCWSAEARHVEDPVWVSRSRARTRCLHHYAKYIVSLFLRLLKFSLCHSLLSSGLFLHRLHQLPDSLPPDSALRFPMAKRTAAQPALALFPPNASIEELQKEAAHCKACDLWKNATQTVFGEGAGAKPKVIFVGEQPGDQEDIEGKPFVGPAGKLLDSALVEAGIDRKKVYVTNAVKHFKWEPRGKRRIHKKPNAIEIAACRPWLDAEIAAIRPNVIVCLGATAAQSLLGRDFRVTLHRGEFLKSDLAPHVMATVHPSSILRAPDDATRHEEMKLFITDLKKVAHHV